VEEGAKPSYIFPFFGGYEIMPIGAIATSGRLSAAFAYVTMFFTFMLIWYIGVYVIEFFFNVFVAAAVNTVFPSVTVPVLNLPDPLELLRDALGYFSQLFGVGNTILWGFVETVTFGLAIIFGLPGALMGAPNALNRVKDFLMDVSDEAKRKY
jgi:hypothetical protein